MHSLTTPLPGARPHWGSLGRTCRMISRTTSPQNPHLPRQSPTRPQLRTHATLKRSITTTEVIKADPAAVWAALVDFSSYPQWNPLIVAMEGPTPLSTGDRLAFTIELPGGGGGRFTPLVLAATPGHELRWRGSLPVPGLFTGERFIRLIEDGPGETRLVHGEHFWGLLIPAVGDVIAKTEEGFALMNAALKRRVEGA